MTKSFPILEKSAKSIPWDAIAPHEKQALRNHDQSLERLAQRGGLGYDEFWFVMNDEDWDDRKMHWAQEKGQELAERLASVSIVK